jgi:PhnB protein
MVAHNRSRLVSSVFITFPGNCKKALSFYQGCFGGKLHLQTFKKQANGFPEAPVVSGSLISDSVIIHGSDLVHSEGRKLGNYIAIYLQCRDTNERSALINKLEASTNNNAPADIQEQKLIEFTDAYDVRWILGI